MASRSTLCALCAQLAFLRAFGYSNSEAVGRVSTDDHPAGIAEKTLYNHQKEHKSILDTIEKWASLNRRERAVTVKELTAETIRKEMEATLGVSWGAIQTAIAEGDTDAAVWHIEQVIGKAKSNLDVKHSGGVLHGHVAVTQELIAAQDKEIAESQQMARAILIGATDGITDAEVIEGAAS